MTPRTLPLNRRFADIERERALALAVRLDEARRERFAMLLLAALVAFAWLALPGGLDAR